MFSAIFYSNTSKARTGVLKTSHGEIKTPAFQVIATKGAVKTLDAVDLRQLGVSIVLANTYHLYLRPGEELLRQVGGLHALMGWDGPLLTDSGGYQVFSLDGKLRITNGELRMKNEGSKSPGALLVSERRSLSAPLEEGGLSRMPSGHASRVTSHASNVKVTDDGVLFRSYIDGSEHLFTPERVLEIQDAIGSDLRMVLDQCVGHPCTREQAEAGVVRTTVWAHRSIESLRRRGDLLGRPRPYDVWGIVQGSIFHDLRERSAREITALDFDGYAIGGLAVGESQAQMLETLAYTAPLLPEDKVRYLMGVGYPEDIVEAVKLGVDLFDCVIPTREARHGRIYEFCEPGDEGARVLWGNVAYRRLEITNERYRNDMTLVQGHGSRVKGQGSPVRAYLRHLFSLNEPTAQRLATLQNVRFYMELMEWVREGIGGGEL